MRSAGDTTRQRQCKPTSRYTPGFFISLIFARRGHGAAFFPKHCLIDFYVKWLILISRPPAAASSFSLPARVDSGPFPWKPQMNCSRYNCRALGVHTHFHQNSRQSLVLPDVTVRRSARLRARAVRLSTENSGSKGTRVLVNRMSKCYAVKASRKDASSSLLLQGCNGEVDSLNL